MKKNFKFRSGAIAPIQDVLDGKVPEAFEYAPITYYRAIADSHPWRGAGKIGVTRALNGTRQAFLDYCIDYDLEIDGTIFMVLGITFHGNMEIGEGVEDLIEFDGMMGRSDLCSKEDGLNVLTDYKFVGSYAIVKTLGVKESGRKPLVDSNGDPVLYQKSGKWGKAGDPKTEAVYKMSFKDGEHFDYSMQINMYRIMYERAGTAIDKMKFWMVPRDGNTMVAKGRGVIQPFYYIEFPRLDDETVLQYFRKKRDELSWRMVDSEQIRAKYAAGELDNQSFIDEAVKLEIMPPVCSAHESWDGRKCKDYCNVNFACKMVGDNKYLSPVKRVKKENEFEGF